MRPLEIDEDQLKLAVRLIGETFEENGIDQLTGACAMVALLKSLERRGIKVGVDTNALKQDKGEG